MRARLYSNENFPLPVVEALRRHGHDALTSLEAGRANQGIPDEEVLEFATAERRRGATNISEKILSYFGPLQRVICDDSILWKILRMPST